jgi:hypothetical protein
MLCWLWLALILVNIFLFPLSWQCNYYTVGEHQQTFFKGLVWGFHSLLRKNLYSWFMLLRWSLNLTVPLMSWSIHLLFLARILVSISTGWGKCCVLPQMTSPAETVNTMVFLDSGHVEWLVQPVWFKFIHNMFTYVSRVLLQHIMIVRLPPRKVSGLPYPVGDLSLKLPGIHSNPPLLSMTKCKLDQNQFSHSQDRHSAFFQNTGILNHFTVC